MRRRHRLASIAFTLVVCLVLTVGLPFGDGASAATSLPVAGSFPLAGLLRWLTPDFAYASGLAALPRLPQAPIEKAAAAPTDDAAPTVPQAPGVRGDDGWTAPVLGGPSKYDPSTSVLIPSLSTATTSVYRNVDGSKSVAVADAPMNYQDAAGNWTPIDVTLAPDEDGRLVPKASPVEVSLAPTAVAPAGATATVAPSPAASADGAVSLDAASTLGSVTLPDGQSVGFGLAGASTVAATVDGGQVRYAEILPDEELELAATTQGIKETIVLDSASAGNEWVFPLALDGLTAAMADDGSVVLSTDRDGVVARVPQPYMWDSTFDASTGTWVSSAAVKQELISLGGVPALRVTADRAWLDDPARTYPISVDPSLVFPTAGDGFVDNDSSSPMSDQGYGTDLTVGTYNGGSVKSRGFIDFNLEGLTGYYITSAKLRTKLSWTYDCNHPTGMNVYAATQAWSEASLTSTAYPGPGLGALLGGAAPSSNYPACQNTGANRSIGDPFLVSLDPTALNQWVVNSQTNFGLALVAQNENDSYSWKRLTSRDYSGGTFQPQLLVDVVDAAPLLTWAYPSAYTQEASLTPRLSAAASTSAPGGTLYRFRVYAGDHQHGDGQTPILDSGTASTQAFYDVPAGSLTWGKQYVWSVELSSAYYTEPQVEFPFTTAVPGQVLTGSLGQNGGQGFAPDGRNYTTTATDVTVGGVGPSLSVARSYNSLDPRADEAFGAGWETLLDARAVEQTLASGSLSVVVTYPSGQQVAFGRNGDGSFSPPLGSFATFVAASGGGYTLTDKDGTVYQFTAPLATGRFGLVSITDPQGHTLSLGRDSAGHVTSEVSASGRTLTLTWSTPSGASAAHVASVTTDPVTPGVSTTALVYSYGYAGDQLTSVCPPGVGAACTAYTYSTTTRYPAAVLDTAPASAWRLDETSGTTATSAVAANGGTDNGTYAHTSVGATSGPLSGAGAKAAIFSSSNNSVVTLPRIAVDTSDHVSVGLWFKTSSSGPLFGESNLDYGQTAPTVSTPGQVASPLYVGSDGKLRGAFPLRPAATEVVGLVGKCLDNWFGNTGDGNPVYLNDCNGGTASQMWTWLPDGSLQIAGKCLDINGASTANGALIQLYTCTHSANQVWLFKSGQLVNPYSGRCLDVTNGNSGNAAVRLQLWDCLGNAQQQWAGPTLPTPITSSGSVKNNQWHFVVLTADGSTQTLYLDGGPVGTLAGTVRLPDVVHSMIGAGYNAGIWPGQSSTTGWQSFSGSIGEVAVWNRALTSAEVSGLETTATSSAAMLHTVTSPGGVATAQVTYVTTDGTVQQVTDANGGVWQVAAPTITGSYQPYASTVLADTPADYWRLADAYGSYPADEVSATAHTAPAVLSGVTVGLDHGPFFDQNGSGDQSTAASFNGTSSFMQLPTEDIPTGGPVSVSLWFRLPAHGSGVLFGSQNTSIFENSSGYSPALYVGTDGLLRGEFWQGGSTPITTTAPVDDGGWHQVVLTASTTGQTLYLDGSQVGTLSGGPQNFGATNVYVGTGEWYAWPGSGAGDGAGHGYWPGDIAEVAYYHSELSATQVALLTAEGSAGKGAQARIIQVTDPAGGHTQTRQDIYGRMLAQVDALGKITQYGYGVAGYLSVIVDPEGAETTMGEDARGNTTSVTTCQAPQVCSTSYFAYDQNTDLLVASRDARSSGPTDPAHLTSYTYDSTGNTIDVVDPLGRHTTTTYTTAATPAVGGGFAPAGLPATVTKPGGGVTSIGYDQAGDIASITDAAGLVTTFGVDGLGRVTSQTVTSSTFPTGLTTTTGYDQAGRVAFEQDPAVLDRVTGAIHTAKTSYTYDTDGHVLTQTILDLTGGDSSRTTTWTYNSHGQATSVTTPGGRTTTSAYDTAGRVHTVTSPAGVTTRTDYDADGRVADTVLQGWTGDPNNPTPAQDLVVAARTYGDAGELTAVTDAQGYVTTYGYSKNGLLLTTTRSGGGSSFVTESNTYDQAGNLTQQVTNNGVTTTDYVVDAGNRITSITAHPGPGLPDRVTTFTYNADDTLAQRSQSAGSTTLSTLTMTYDPMGRLLTSTLADPTLGPLTTTLTRDEQGLITSMTDPAGHTTDYSLDEAGRSVVTVAPTTTSEVFGTTPLPARAVSYTGYDTFGEATESKDPDGNVTTIAYDADGHPIHSTGATYTPPGTSTPITPVTTLAYDSAGKQSSATDPLGRVTGYAYDQLGRLATLTDPAGGHTTYTYDLLGDTTAVTDPTGATTEAHYDYLGRVTLQRQDVRQTSSTFDTTTTYNDSLGGWPTTVTTPTGVVTATTYDKLGEPLTVKENNSLIATYAYDGLGRLTSTTNADNTSTALAYNALGEAVSQTDKDASGAPLRSQTFTYDTAGKRVTATDARGYTTSFTYDATGLPLTQTQPVNPTDAITTSIGYDLAGNPTHAVSGNGQDTWVTYNPWNLAESQIEPATTAYPNLADRTFTTSYDADGEPTDQLQPGGVTSTNTYNSLGLVTGQTGSGAEATTTARGFGYDAAGRLTTFSGPGGTNTLSYDDRGLLTATSGGSGTASFAYNGDGSMTQRVDASGTTNYTYDARQRLTGVSFAGSTLVSSITYDSMSAPTKITYGSSGDTRTLSYDGLHRLTGDQLKHGSTQVAKITYGFDADDDETAKTTVGFGSGTIANTYTYDQADRLISWDDGTTPTVYAYDDDGNRVQAGSTLFTFDARDEVTGSSDTVSGATATYSYSARGGLLSAATVGVGTVATTSDAFGQVISQGAAGGGSGTSTYAYDGLGRLVRSGAPYSGVGASLAADGSATYAYTPGGGVLGVRVSSTTRAAWADLHTDVVAQFTTSASSLAASVVYDPWGVVVGGSGTVSGSLGYQSEYSDPATGQVDMGARWYAPDTGAFTTRDSVASANRYAYVGGNPLTNADVTGHGLGSLVSSIKNKATQVGTAIVSGTVQAGAFVYTVAKTGIEDLAKATGTTSLLNALVDSSLVQGLKNAIVNSSLGQYVANNYSDAIDAGTKAGNDFTTYVTNTVDDLASGVQQKLVDGWNTIKTDATTVWQDASTFVNDHKAELAGLAAGLVVGGLCTLATAGAGALGCAVLAGAATSLVTGYMNGQRGWSLALTTAEGALTALAFGGLGELAGPLLSKGMSAVGGTLVKSILGTAARDGLQDLAEDAGSVAARDLAETLGDDLGNTIGKDTAQDLETDLGSDLGDDLGSDAGDDLAADTHPTEQPSETGPSDNPETNPTNHNPGEEEPAGGGNRDPEKCETNSFTGDTPILLANGTSKPIDQVTIGDTVTATDPTTGVTQAEPVTMLHLNHDTNLLDVTITTTPTTSGTGIGEGQGERSTRGPTTTIIHTTTEHPFWDNTSHSWVDAANLIPDQSTLLQPDGATVTVTAITPHPGDGTMYNLTIHNTHTYYVVAGSTPVLVHNCDEYFRGAKSGEQPSFVPRPNEYKVDPATGFVKDTHGVSVFDNAESVSSRGFVPHQLDTDTIPDSLRIIQRGADPKHFEIVPKPGANLTPEDFTAALCQIQCLRPGS